MSRHNFFHSSRFFQSGTTAGLLLMTSFFAFPAAAQTGGDPVEFGAQLPYVMILMDTSASMEWTDKGDARYPERIPAATDPNTINEWVQGTSLRVTNKVPAVETVGPCYVWRPKCSDYQRPAWCADTAQCDWLGSNAYTDGTTPMLGEITKMRASSIMRLAENNMPRHVMLKEILAGDMVLKSSAGSGDSENRPGCWFVPRFKSSLQNIKARVCESELAFTRLVDADDPRPHIQEVYDYRENNGLLERMANTVLLGVTMFDGYQHDGNGWGMDDILAGNSPISTRLPLLPGYNQANKSEDHYSRTASAGKNYNLGIYRVIGPTTLNIGLDKTRSIAKYAQNAIADAGYISSNNGAPYMMNIDNRHDSFIQPYPLAKQPMAGATPLAAAMHDIYQYFLNGQYKERTPWALNNNDQYDVSKTFNPFDIDNDPHRTCRPKHVIILTDGYPEPEAPGGAGNGLGSENMASGFGYDIERYPYGLTEDLIKSFVNDGALGVSPSGDYKKHMPRVHVIGVNVADGVASNVGTPGVENSKEVLTKLAVMAERGNTCAQYYMPIEMLPVGVKTGTPKLDAAGAPLSDDGICDPQTQVCLQKQSGLLGGGAGFAGYFYYPDGPGTTKVFPCEHPALIFNQNDKATIRSAFQAVFNEIISSSGIAARTRPSMTSYLDLPVNISGQYRMYAGVKMEGGSPFWKGILNQESHQCTAEGGLSTPPTTGSPMSVFRSLHNEISLQRLSLAAAGGANAKLEEAAVTKDRRRVFTMVPSPTWYDHKTDRPIANNVALDPRLVKLADRDEFGKPYVSEGTGPANDIPKGTRIPFEYDTLLDAYVGIQKPFNGSEKSLFYSYLNISNATNPHTADFYLRELIDEVRGRSAGKFDRVLGGIFQSNPVTVGPPDLAVPIDSYRQFRARFADRPTMLYVGTLDGQLHAIYTGQPNVKHRQETAPADAGNGSNEISLASTAGFHQREAWAYIPHMLHGQLKTNFGAQPRLLDGSPVVSDVRLCSGIKADNTNGIACANNSETPIPELEQWRTVLVQGLGDAGRGYFALDVTRTGDKDHAPDPIPLWEFNGKWEFGQLLAAEEDYAKSFFGSDVGNNTKECGPVSQAEGRSLKQFQVPYMGSSVGEAAIGTVAIDGRRRAVAIFSAGLSGDAVSETDDFNKCHGAGRIGRAIYVVDLQSGQMLRRFVHYENEDGKFAFDEDVVGTPALYDEFPGSLVTRGFVGDAAGRLFRIDLTGTKPKDWKVTEFFNPDGFSQAGIDVELHAGTTYGPAAFRPALTMNAERKLVVIYGLGARGDTETYGQTQFIIALQEDIVTLGTVNKVVSRPIFAEKFALNEKLTGEPVIFNNGVYFTTYNKTNGADACELGKARIYGLGFTLKNNKPVGLWDVNPPGNLDNTNIFVYGADDGDGKRKWFGPVEPTLIRGVAITMGASCSDFIDEDGNEKPFSEETPRKPQLIAQTGSATGNQPQGPGGSGPGAGGALSDTINTITVDLARPRSQSIPLSWTVITN